MKKFKVRVIKIATIEVEAESIDQVWESKVDHIVSNDDSNLYKIDHVEVDEIKK